MKKRKTKILTLFVGCILFASCVSDFDVDRYLIEKENSLIELHKEDAAIRADLEKGIIKMRSDMQPKIAEVKDRLSTKVDSNGNLVISALMDSVAASGTRISERVSKTKDYVDEQMTNTKSGIETIFTNLETKRQTLNTQLQQAITQSNEEQEANINTRLSAIDQLEIMANTVKTKVENLESNLQLAENLLQQMGVLEERSEILNTNFNSFNTKISRLLDLLEEDIDENLESLKAEQILMFKDNLSEAEGWLESVRDFFTEVDGLVDEAESFQSEMADLEYSIDDMIDQVEGALSDAQVYTGQMEDIMGQADDLDSDADDFLSRLDNLDSVVSDYESGDDPSGLWDDFDTLQSNLLDLISTSYNFDGTVSELGSQADQAYSDFDDIYNSDAWK